MSATFDATTTAEYAAASTAAARSALIVAALTGTISVKVFNGSNTEMGSGTMDSPWATASGDTVTVGEVTSFTVGSTATPDADWYIRFQNAGVTRRVRGSFGLSSSSQDFTWSLGTWTATHTGTIGTATITTSGNAAPAFTVAPTTANIAAAGGTIQFTAVDPDGDSVVYSLTTTRFGITIDSSTGLVTVTSSAAATSGNIVVQASDGTLTASATCAVTVQAVGDSETLDYADPIFGVALSGGRTTINVTSTATLQAAIDGATAGTTIQLAVGTYPGAVTVNKTFAAADALIIKGAASFASVATGTWTMTGARQIVTGIKFSGSNAKCTVGGTNNKLIGNKFTGWGNGTAISASRSSSYGEIAYNELSFPSAWVIGESSYPLRIGVRTQDDGAADFHYNGWLHHNYFHDFPDKPTSDYGSGQSDAIEIGETHTGTYPNVNSGWYVESNLIKDHAQGTSTGAANVDFKVGGIVARYNTFDNSAGHFDVRGGTYHGCTIESNYIPSGMFMHGRGHRFIGNNVSSGIRLMAGNQVVGANALGYSPCEDALCVGNIGPITVGYYWSGQTPTVPCNNTTLMEQSDAMGSITIKPSTPAVQGYATNTVNDRYSDSGINYTPAVALTSADVGPDAISSASIQYKAARGL